MFQKVSLSERAGKGNKPKSIKVEEKEIKKVLKSDISPLQFIQVSLLSPGQNWVLLQTREKGKYTKIPSFSSADREGERGKWTQMFLTTS